MTGHDEWAPDVPTSPAAVVVPGYSGLTEVARGGDSIVYRGRQDSLGRDVAIKVIDVTDPTAQARFARELAITVRLGRQHPHVVTVLDTTTTADGRPCLVMEFHDLGSLHDRLRAHGPLPVSEVVAAGTAVADALAFAHTHGVLHRDVKPQNVLLLPTSYVLSDFGIARMADAGHTASLERFSYRHASPQVLDGAEPTEADDVWSLGSTLFTLLDGRAPFASDDPDDDSALAYLRRVRMDERRPLRGDVPPKLRAVVDACLTPDRAARTMGAADVLAALRRVPTEDRSWAPPGTGVTAAEVGASGAAAAAAAVPGAGGARVPDADTPPRTDETPDAAPPPVEPALPTAPGPVDLAAAGLAPEAALPAATDGTAEASAATSSSFAPAGTVPGTPAPSPASAGPGHPPADLAAPQPQADDDGWAATSSSSAPSASPTAAATPPPAAVRPPATSPAVAPSALAEISAEPQVDADHTSAREPEQVDDPPATEAEAKPASSSWTKVAAFIGGALVVGTGFGVLSALLGDDEDAPAPAPSATAPVEVPTMPGPLPTVTGPVQASTGDPDLAPRNPAALDNGTSVLLTWADPVSEVDYILVLDPGDDGGPASVVHQLAGGAQEHTVEGIDPDASEVCFVVAGYAIEDGTPTPGAGPAVCVTRG